MLDTDPRPARKPSALCSCHTSLNPSEPPRTLVSRRHVDWFSPRLSPERPLRRARTALAPHCVQPTPPPKDLDPNHQPQRAPLSCTPSSVGAGTLSSSLGVSSLGPSALGTTAGSSAYSGGCGGFLYFAPTVSSGAFVVTAARCLLLRKIATPIEATMKTCGIPRLRPTFKAVESSCPSLAGAGASVAGASVAVLEADDDVAVLSTTFPSSSRKTPLPSLQQSGSLLQQKLPSAHRLTLGKCLL